MEPTEDVIPLTKVNDIVISMYDTNNTLFTNQTGKFPHISSRGNRYQMIFTMWTATQYGSNQQKTKRKEK